MANMGRGSDPAARLRQQQPLVEQRLHNVGLKLVAPALGRRAFRCVLRHPALEFDERCRGDSAHGRHPPGGGDHRMFEARRFGKDRGALRPHWPQVTRIAGKLERMRVVPLGHAAQEDHLKAGMLPGDPGFGVESGDFQGILNTEWQELAFRGKIESLPGHWMGLFQNMADVLLRGADPLIPTAEVLAQVRIMEQVGKSSGKR